MNDATAPRILLADLDDPSHRDAILALHDAYVREPHISGAPLPPDVRERLIPALRAHETTEILIAFVDGAPAGLAICFRGFSTFKAQPVLNIHDLSVQPEHRGSGVGLALLDATLARGRDLGCCKLTLEVHESNRHALEIYRRYGFGGHQAGGDEHHTLFLEKPIDAQSER